MIEDLIENATKNANESLTQFRRIVTAFTRGAMALPDALVAIAELSERIATLGKQLERVNNSIDSATSRMDVAADGMRKTVSGIREVVDVVGDSIPDLAKSALSLNDLADRLGKLGTELASELPKTTAVLRGISPELSRVVNTLDTRLDHLDGVVSDLSRTIMSMLGAIPGLRRALRPLDRSSGDVTVVSETRRT